MAIFDYKGRSSNGQSVTGQLEASSPEVAANVLGGRGITPIDISEFTIRETGIGFLKDIGRESRVELQDLIMFCRQMYTITKSGIPLVKGIRSLAESLRHFTFQKVLREIASKLETGVELSIAMRQHPKVFNHLFISLIAVGENSGNLDRTFQQIGEYIERDSETVRSIKQALRYPTFVFIALALAMIIINLKVIPAFATMFKQFDAELPMPTQVLIGISNFFVNYWVYMLAVSILGGYSIYNYINTPKGSVFWGKKKLGLPVIGDLIERASMARYARSFALMIEAGLPLTASLDLCAKAIDNNYLAEKINGIRTGVERGEGLYQTHLMSGMFTPLVLQMISVGEESGQVGPLLTEVAEFYEREVDYDVKKLSDKIEPIMIVVMAGFVMILALGIFLPMWDMYSIQK